MMKKRTSPWLVAMEVATILVLLGGIVVGSTAHAQIPAINVKPYQVLAFNDLGMHCYDSD
jgi:hypothetical protein